MAHKTQQFLLNIFNHINKFLSNYKIEFIAFLSFLGVSCIYLFSTRYIVSLDGPQHLYNSQVLIDLFKSNDLVSQFFKINPVIVGYWTSHLILAILNWMLPAWLAEKLFILICITGLAFAFRYFIRSFTTKTTYLFLLIIPFLNHQYLLFGYYAFSLVWIFFFLTLGYFFRNYNQSGIKKSIILSLLLILTFLTHMIVFAFTLFVMGAYIIYDIVFFSEHRNLIKLFKQKYLFVLKYLIIILPASVLAVIYYKHVSAIHLKAVARIFTSNELWEYVCNFKFLVAFNHLAEQAFNRVLFLITAILLVYSLVVLIMEISGKTKEDKYLIKIKVFLLIISGLVFTIYFAAPDLFGTGSLKMRILVFFFFLIIPVIVLTKIPRYLQVATAIIIMWYLIGIFNSRNESYLKLSHEAKDFEAIENRMNENSVYFQVRAIKNWSNEHTPLFTGSDKTLINIRNPQCMGHFPIVWNWDNMPTAMMGAYSSADTKHLWFANYGNKNRLVKIDYIVIYGYWDFMINKDYDDLREKINEYYYLDTLTGDGLVGLYKFNLSEQFDSILNKNTKDEFLKDYFTVKSLQYKTSFENAVYLVTVEDFRIYEDEPISVNYYLKRIFVNSNWLDQVKLKAAQKNISVNEMAEIDAKYMYDKNSEHNNSQIIKDVDYHIRAILKDEEWRKAVNNKAIEKEISFHKMVLLDAQYLYKTTKLRPETNLLNRDIIL